MFLDVSETPSKYTKSPPGHSRSKKGFPKTFPQRQFPSISHLHLQQFLLRQAYVLADTSLAGYRRYQQQGSREEIAAACAHTAVFQTVASLALPADAWAYPYHV